jgi:chorismate-pyruvate lyase
VNAQDELKTLTNLFPGEEPLFAAAEHIPRTGTPEPYRSLLVHNHHMTVTMEQYHGCSVDVRVIDKRLEDELYCRRITLVKQGTDQVVQFGIVRFNFHYVTQDVRDEILRGDIPLGRILIDYNVLREVELAAIVKLTAGPGLARCLQMPEGGTTYGRLATIFCNHQPAVDLLEVSAPLSLASS